MLVNRMHGTRTVYKLFVVEICVGKIYVGTQRDNIKVHLRL
jgi:hypothetical protein